MFALIDSDILPPAFRKNWARLIQKIYPVKFPKEDPIEQGKFGTGIMKGVMVISGLIRVLHLNAFSYSYWFTRDFSCWGWASWRWALQYFDIRPPLRPVLKNTSWLRDILWDRQEIEIYGQDFDRAQDTDGNVDYWNF